MSHLLLKPIGKMRNHTFHFKAFSIFQENTAMKVCTDSCLFGAWAVNIMKMEHPEASNLLDIGTGTGVLSLMAAQKMNVMIDAVEIDAEAVHDASKNFRNSPWPKRISIHHTPIQDFIPPTGSMYDIIICNPPFFSKSLNSPEKKKNLSKHENNLQIVELVNTVSSLLRENGFAFFMLPANRSDFEKILTDHEISIHHLVHVHQTPTHPAFRTLYCVGRRTPQQMKRESITIKDEAKSYSREFTNLLKSYYLAL